MRPSTGATGTILTVLHNSDFRTIWYVGSLGEVGRRMELLVLSWLLLQLTDSYFQLGLVFAFNNLPRPPGLKACREGDMTSYPNDPS